MRVWWWRTMIMMFLIEISKYDDDVFDQNIRVCWWCFWSKDQSMMMIFLCWWCFWSKYQSMMMMIMIDRSEYDDDDVATDREVKVLKMLLLIERSRCWRCCCWSKSQNARCCWSKGQNAQDVVADRKIKVLKMFLIERSKWWRCCCWSNSQNSEDVADRSSQRINDDEDWRLKTTRCWKASNDL